MAHILFKASIIPSVPIYNTGNGSFLQKCIRYGIDHSWMIQQQFSTTSRRIFQVLGRKFLNGIKLTQVEHSGPGRPTRHRHRRRRRHRRRAAQKVGQALEVVGRRLRVVDVVVLRHADAFLVLWGRCYKTCSIRNRKKFSCWLSRRSRLSK